MDGDTLRAFVAAYQTVTPLRLGELWAIPIMLRLGLLENLRRVAARVMRDGIDHRLASDWADRLNTSGQNAILKILEEPPAHVVLQELTDAEVALAFGHRQEVRDVHEVGVGKGGRFAASLGTHRHPPPLRPTIGCPSIFTGFSGKGLVWARICHAIPLPKPSGTGKNTAGGMWPLRWRP